jgi:hypothetical protein
VKADPSATPPAQLQAIRREPLAPLTVDYKAIIMGVFHDILKDPMSAVVEFSEPIRVTHLIQPFNATSLHSCRRVDVNINAKNSFGAYIGFSTYQFWFHNNQLIDKTL